MKYLISRLKIKMVGSFPFLSSISRFFKAIYYSCLGQRQSYSQHGEDQFVWDLLNTHFPDAHYNYVDVGGFHPVLLSNTYLLYRKNMNGVVVEPNPELVNLHRIFRSRDIQLPVACGNESKLSKFYLQKTFPALSSLNGNIGSRNISCRYVPLLSLDNCLDNRCRPGAFCHLLFISRCGRL